MEDLFSKDIAHRKGLRSIALFEALKGLIGVAAGLAIIAVAHKDISDIAERVLSALHVNLESRLANMVLNASDKATPKSLMLLAVIAFIYAAVRFVEAYGLWNSRVWAEWFALISGLIYLPWEILGLLRHATYVKWTILAINIVVVLYIATIRIESFRSSEASD